MTHKILKCIPKLVAQGATTQAASMINVVKASIEISQEYKDLVCVLPPHFITLMYDLYKGAIYSVSESAMNGYDKDLSIVEAEKEFNEKSEKAVAVLNNTAKILEVLRNDMSAEYDKIKSSFEEVKPTTLEKSLEATASLESTETIQKMIEYVKLLKPEQRLALIYSLGLTSYVDMNNITTASIDEEDVLEDKAVNDKFGIYSVEEIKEKLKEAMLSHQFTSSDLEYDVLYTVVENISDKTIGSVLEEVKSKVSVNESASAESLDELFESLDSASEKLTDLLAMPAHVIFLIKEDNICMVAAFFKEDANKVLKSSEAGILVDRDNLASLRKQLIGIKEEMESFSDELEDLNANHEDNSIVELARKISADMKTLYSKFNADSSEIDIYEE